MTSLGRIILPRETAAVAAAPLVSVIMPVKNVEDWISESLISVLTQSLTALELIVVDDGSIDETLTIVRSFQASDDRIKIIQSGGSGGAPARNLGISVASGEFLAFADGDDIVPWLAYEKLTDQALLTGSAMVVGSHLVLEPQLLTDRQTSLPLYQSTRAAITLRDEPRFLRDRVCWNRIIRRSAWNNVGLSFIDSQRSNDIAAMVHAYCAFPFDVIPAPVYVYRRRVGDSSMTASKLRADSVVAHLVQEALCLRAVVRLQDTEVLRVYFEGILHHDLWAHGSHLYVEPALTAAHFDLARGKFHDLVRLAPLDAFGSLSEEQRLVYAFIRGNKVDFAAAILARKNLAGLRRHLHDAPLSALIAAAHELADNINGVLTEAFRTVSQLLTDPEQLNQLDDALTQRTLTELRDAKAAGIPTGRLSAIERELVKDGATCSTESMRALRIDEADAQERRTITSQSEGVHRRKIATQALLSLRSLAGRMIRAAGLRRR